MTSSQIGLKGVCNITNITNIIAIETQEHTHVVSIQR